MFIAAQLGLVGHALSDRYLTAPRSTDRTHHYPKGECHYYDTDPIIYFKRGRNSNSNKHDRDASYNRVYASLDLPSLGAHTISQSPFASPVTSRTHDLTTPAVIDDRSSGSCAHILRLLLEEQGVAALHIRWRRRMHISWRQPCNPGRFNVHTQRRQWRSPRRARSMARHWHHASSRS